MSKRPAVESTSKRVSNLDGQHTEQAMNLVLSKLIVHRLPHDGKHNRNSIWEPYKKPMPEPNMSNELANSLHATTPSRQACAHIRTKLNVPIVTLSMLSSQTLSNALRALLSATTQRI